MRGLDPRIHGSRQGTGRWLDRRVKPGNDNRGGAAALLNNGIEHTAPEEEVVAAMIGVAEGSLSEAELAAWFRDTSGKKTRHDQGI
jgi:hypothetical protein